MKEFIRKHENRIHGVLSCFDRMLIRGYLPIISGWAMAQFLNILELDGSNLKPFLLKDSERVKNHAVAMARKYNRRYEYLRSNIRKEDRAQQLAERDGIREGLVCIPGVFVDYHLAILPADKQTVIRRIGNDVVPAAVPARRIGMVVLGAAS